MRRQSPRLALKNASCRHGAKQGQSQIDPSAHTDYSHIHSALETLDNKHALALLKTFQLLSQSLLCMRTALAHQLEEHEYCLPFAKQSLQKMANCRACLEVYLSHRDSIPVEDLPLSSEIMQTLQQHYPDLLPQTVELFLRNPNAQRYFNFTQNLKQSGSIVHKVAITQGHTGRRVIATQNINKNDQLLFIPRDQMITLELCQTLPLVKKINTSKVSLKSPKHTQFAIFLLTHHQLGSESPFQQYLQLLPHDFSHFPVNYPEPLLQQLKGTCFLQQIQHKKSDMRKDYQTLIGLDSSFSRFPFQKFIEARLTVSSRVFGIIIQQHKTDALVPIADMLNHRLPKQTSWFYNDHDGGFVVQSLKDISAGLEIFDSYGHKCNSRFLLNYGFVLPSNQHNQVVLEIDLANMFGGMPRAVKIRINKFLQSKGFQDMIGLLRATVDGQREKKQGDEQEIAIGLQIIKQTAFKSNENELSVWRAVLTLINNKLEDYPTTIAEDKKLLKQNLDQRMVNIIILRKGEKQVLTFYQNMCKKMIKLFSTQSRKGDLSQYQPYLRSIDVDLVNGSL